MESILVTERAALIGLSLSVIFLLIAIVFGIVRWRQWRRERPAITYDPNVIHGPMENTVEIPILVIATAPIPAISPSAHGDTPLIVGKVAKVRRRGLQSPTR